MEAAGHHSSEFIVVAQQAKAYDAGEQNENRAQHVDDKRDTEEKEFENQANGFAGVHEFVDLFKKIDKDVYGYEGSSNDEKCTDKLGQYVSIKKCHGDYQRKRRWASTKPIATMPRAKKFEMATYVKA